MRSRELLSRKLLLPLYQTRRAWSPSTRAAFATFRDGMRFRRASEAWSSDRKSAWVLERLRMVVRRANRETDYYRKLFALVGFDPEADFDFDDFAQLPVLERADVQEAGDSIISTALPKKKLRRDATGGSTGRPVQIWLGPEERGWRESGIEWHMQRVGVPAGSRVAYLWGHHLDPVGASSLGDRLRDFVHNVEWYDCFRLSEEKLAVYHARLQHRPPVCIVAYAKALADLAGVASRADEPCYPTRCLLTGAEMLVPDHRATIEEVFQVPVHERYGSRDVGLIAFQLDVPRDLDFTVDWTNIMVEPASAGGDSEILITKLRADGMPMLRYRIGDVARSVAEARPGQPCFALGRLRGRNTDRVWLPDGGWVDGSVFPHLLKDYALRDFRITQRRDWSVLVEIVPSERFADDAERQVLETIAANLRGVEVSLNRVREIARAESHKWRPVQTELQRPGSRECEGS